MKVAAIFLIALTITVACKTGGPTQSAGVAVAAASPDIIRTTGYVTDEAKVIDEATRKQLETTLATLKKRKHIDFAVVTVRSTGDKSAFDYSLDLARERKKNSLEQNPSGLLLLVAVDDRNWHIQITNNLEKDLTKDVLTNLSTPMTDSFRQKQYGEGILKYVNAIIAKIDQLDNADV
jgi:uncharacterized membrane protein YgcG